MTARITVAPKNSQKAAPDICLFILSHVIPEVLLPPSKSLVMLPPRLPALDLDLRLDDIFNTRQRKNLIFIILFLSTKL